MGCGAGKGGRQGTRAAAAPLRPSLPCPAAGCDRARAVHGRRGRRDGAAATAAAPPPPPLPPPRTPAQRGGLSAPSHPLAAGTARRRRRRRSASRHGAMYGRRTGKPDRGRRHRHADTRRASRCVRPLADCTASGRAPARATWCACRTSSGRGGPARRIEPADGDGDGVEAAVDGGIGGSGAGADDGDGCGDPKPSGEPDAAGQ